MSSTAVTRTALFGASLVALVALAPLVACARPAEPAYHTVASTADLMEGIIQPAASKVFEVGGWASTTSGVTKLVPADEEEWAIIKHHAMALAEMGNYLKAFDARKAETVWATQAQSMIDRSLEVSKAAEAMDAGAVFEAGGRLYETCTGCHITYLPGSVAPAEVPQ